GQTIASALTSWQVSRGSLLVEKLACSNDRSVYVFSRSPARDWRALNVALCTSQQIAGPLISWQTPDDPYIVEHLAGADPNDHLQIFSW
ncbi:MAG TPA: hypothetical protein VFP86_03755, partial [bacterium]|nr:hypothetical protein [bacterium]